MSKPQTEYETDAEFNEDESWEVAKIPGIVVRVDERDQVASVRGRSEEEMLARARLIAAAGTAAQELPDEYDAVAAVEALSEGLDAARRAIIDLQEAHTSGPPEDSAEAAAQAASHRLKVFMAEAGADETMIPGDASVALASAEGSEE
jgi:hypothetical protein